MSSAVFRAVPLQRDVPLGCQLLDKQDLTFRLWAPHASGVSVVVKHGELSEAHPMEKEASGDHFQLQLHCEKPLSELHQPTYHYEIESSWNDCYAKEGAILSRRDPYARFTDFNSDECFVPLWLIDADPNSPFAFNEDCAIPSPRQWNVYELHCGSFFSDKTGDCFDGVRRKLAYIKEMGFTAIELMPVQEFGGSWGYNPRLLMAIHPPLGTPQSLRTLVNVAHSLGLAVIFDLVLNHGSAKRNSLWMFDGYGPSNNGGIYFESGKETGWGRQFNFGSQLVRNMIRDTVEVFINEYRADGIRFDSVHNMEWHFLKELTRSIKAKHPSVFLIAEITPENPAVIRDLSFDNCWIHADYYDALKLLNGAERDIEMLMKLCSGPRHFSDGLQMTSSILGSHDQVGNRHNGRSDDPRSGRYLVDTLGGRSNWHARAKCRMLFALQALGRQMPMIFQGEETLQGGWWNVDEAHHLNWASMEEQTSQEYMALVKHVNKLRQKYTSLQCTEAGIEWTHQDRSNLVLGGLRKGDRKVFIIVNCSENEWKDNYQIKLPFDPRNEEVIQILNTQAAEFGGWEDAWAVKLGSAGLRLLAADSPVVSLSIPKWSVSAFACN